MEKSLAIFAIINFTIIGLSHLFQHQGWREFFAMLCEKGKAGAFANGFLTLASGSLIIAFHNIWTGIPMVLTFVGWAYLLKSLVIFIFPDWNLRSMASVENASATKFRLAGLGLLIVAAVLSCGIWMGSYDTPA